MNNLRSIPLKELNLEHTKIIQENNRMMVSNFLARNLTTPGDYYQHHHLYSKAFERSIYN